MSTIGTLVVNVQADIGGFAKGTQQARTEADKANASFLEMDVRFRALRRAAYIVQSMVAEVGRLGETSRETGLSIHQLSHGLITEEDVSHVQHLLEAFKDLKATVANFGGSQGSGIASFLADAIDENIALLSGSTATAVRAEREGKKIAESVAKNREQVQKESLERQNAAQQDYVSKQRQAAEQVAKQQEKIFELTHGEDAAARRKFADLSPTDQTYRTFLAQQQQVKELEEAKKQADDAEKQRLADLKQAEEAKARAEEDSLRKAEQLYQESLTPQEKYVEKLWEIRGLAEKGLIDEEIYNRANKAALEERDKALKVEPRDDKVVTADGAAAVSRGSQEAFSALARFSRGDDTSKIPEKSLGELQKINRELIRTREKPANVVQSF